MPDLHAIKGCFLRVSAYAVNCSLSYMMTLSMTKSSYWKNGPLLFLASSDQTATQAPTPKPIGFPTSNVRQSKMSRSSPHCLANYQPGSSTMLMKLFLPSSDTGICESQSESLCHIFSLGKTAKLDSRMSNTESMRNSKNK